MLWIINNDSEINNKHIKAFTKNKLKIELEDIDRLYLFSFNKSLFILNSNKDIELVEKSIDKESPYKNSSFYRYYNNNSIAKEIVDTYIKFLNTLEFKKDSDGVVPKKYPIKKKFYNNLEDQISERDVKNGIHSIEEFKDKLIFNIEYIEEFLDYNYLFNDYKKIYTDHGYNHSDDTLTVLLKHNLNEYLKNGKFNGYDNSYKSKTFKNQIVILFNNYFSNSKIFKDEMNENGIVDSINNSTNEVGHYEIEKCHKIEKTEVKRKKIPEKVEKATRTSGVENWGMYCNEFLGNFINKKVNGTEIENSTIIAEELIKKEKIIKKVKK